MGDTQVLELRGRHWLISQLLDAGIEVALPIRDHGVDLVAYIDIPDLESERKRFLARPLQLKAATKASVGIMRKYEKFPDLLFVFVWYLDDPSRTCAYVLGYGHLLQIAEQMGWTATASWRQNGWYTNNQPGQRLLELLQPYLATNDSWRALLTHEA